MRALLMVALGVAALAATSSASEAADGCGRGRFWNGYRCATVHAPAYRVYRDDYGPRYDNRYAPRGGGYRTFNGCPPHYTIQDGVCKPYRGG